MASRPQLPELDYEALPPERLDLADRAAELGLALPELVPVRRRLAAERRPLVDLDARAVPPLDLAPDGVGLREEHVRVEREHARVRLDREEHVEQHRLLLLEGAGQRDPAREGVEHRGEQRGADLGRAERLPVALR